MEKPGEYLKAAREAKGLTLSEMAERTRISLSFLQAVEEDDYDSIPGEVFVTGFLRSYAKELGLKEKEVMARYREVSQGENQASPEPQKKPDRYAPPAPAKKAVSGRLIYILVMGVVAAVAAYLLAGPSEGPAPKPVTSPPAAEKPAVRQAATFAGETSAFGRTTTVTASAAETLAEAPPQKIPEGTAVYLRLTAREETWYNVNLDGSGTRSDLLEPGEVMDIAAKREVVLDLGNAGGVDITYNGKPIKPFGPTGAVRRGILFTKDKPGVIQPRPVRIHSIRPAG